MYHERKLISFLQSLLGDQVTSLRHLERSFTICLASFQWSAISARSSLNVFGQVLVGLPLFLRSLCHRYAPTPSQYVLSDLSITVEYIQRVSVVDI